MKALLALIRKDFLVELRSKETLVLMLTLSLLLGVVVAFGANSAFLNPAMMRKTFPVFLWLVFIFTATVSIGRSFDFEQEHMGLEGLLLAGTSPGLIYCSKVLTNFLVVLSGHLFSLAVLSVLLNVDILNVLPELVLLSVFVALAYSALSSVLAAMASSSLLKNMLLPLILLPLLFPIFFAALEITADLLVKGSIDMSSFWVSLLLVLNLLYMILGVNLYGSVIRE